MKKYDSHAVLSKRVFISLLLGALLLAVVPARGAVSYWVAPAAENAGSGADPLDAASYLNSSFWSTVQSQLGSQSVNVNFESGAYTTGIMGLTNMGNPLHQLVLGAVTPQAAVFGTNTVNPSLQLIGSQNVELNGFLFTGNVTDWSVYCIPNYLNPCRNIVITNCWFINLTNYYADIGLLNGTRSVQVLGCNFTNLTLGDHAHIVYASHDIEDVVVSNCVIQDNTSGDYLRFRDDSEYAVVENNTFISTENSSGWPFVSAELYNETNGDSAGDEFFGTYFQVSDNSFTYKAGGPGPLSSMHFMDDSWSPESFYCDLTSAQASSLGSGSQSFQQSFLQTNMGIIGSAIKIFGNTYSGVTYHMDYEYLHDDSTAPYNNWTGTENINNAADTNGTPMVPVPVLRNGNFDRQGLLTTSISVGDKDYECLFRDWLCSPKYTPILRTSGFQGTTNALLLNVADTQYVYQWITPPGPNWTMDLLFAIGSSFSGTGTKFKVDLFHNDITGSKVSIGVNSSGQFGIYNGGTFNTLSQLGTVAFSVDANNNGNYTDTNDTLNVYRLRVVGNYNAATPYVDIYTSDANSTLLDHYAPGNTSWVNSSPTSGQSSPETIALYNYTAPVLVDQITIAHGIPPTISGTLMQGNSLILNGTNGSAGDVYYVLSTTNVALPLANWTCVSTNTFAGSSFSVTNTMAPGTPQTFYSLQLQ